MLADVAYATSVEEIQAKSFAKEQTVISALKDFSTSFVTFRQNNGLLSVDDLKEKLKGFYVNKFLDQYNRKNPQKVIGLDGVFQKLDDDAIALQYYNFLANDKAVDPTLNVVGSDNSQWTIFSIKYQSFFSEYSNYFRLSDVYLVDADSGNIVYSINKKIDFATNLKTGFFANTALGKTFQSVISFSDRENTYTSNIEGVISSLNEPYRFVGASIFDGEKRIGVLIFQLPIGM